MSWASSEIVSVLVFLLPGFVAAAVFYSLTSYPKPNEFGQIIQALMFTLVGQLAAWGIQLCASPDTSWPIALESTVSVSSAIIFALIAVCVLNSDIAHRFFRFIRVTRENSYPSEWYSAFAHNTDCYVVLHLDDGNRVYGWPAEWPSRPNQGHFRIIEANWLNGEESESEDEEISEIYEIILSASSVIMVEFVKAEEIPKE